MSTVIGVFNQTEAAEKAVKALRDKGFTENEISIIAKDQGKTKTKKGDMEVGGDFGTRKHCRRYGMGRCFGGLRYSGRCRGTGDTWHWPN